MTDALLDTCPICLHGPVLQRGKSRLGGLLTKPHFLCGFCGSELDPVGDNYRYRKISSDYPEMRHLKATLFHSFDELAELAQRRLESAAAEDERQKRLAADQERRRTLQDRLRPATLDDFLGQEPIKRHLSVSIEAANARDHPLGHVLLCGPVGCGKRTLALVIAHDLGTNITTTSADAIPRPNDLVAIITNLGPRDVLFVDNIRGLRRIVEERLYRAMDDFAIDIVIGKGPSAKIIQLPLPQFTLIAATNQPQKLRNGLRSRFDHICHFEPYDEPSLARLMQRRAEVLHIPLEEEASWEIARSANGDLNDATRLLRRVRDFADVRANGTITTEIARSALQGSPLTSAESDAEHIPLTWQEFETFVANLFEALGYQNVRLTPHAGDEGKDIEMEWADPLRGTRRIYVECKHWQTASVGRREVQVLHSAVVANPDVDEGILVTTGSFSHGAVAYAKQVGVIQLIDRIKLRELMVQAGM